MIEKVLIANRGEIALRVIRTCRAMGIKTVAVYSDEDTNSLHVKQASESYHIGEAAPAKSYLNQEKILDVILSSLLKYNNKNMTINFNQKSIINIFKNNIHISSKFISKFSIFYSRVRMFGSEFTQREVEKKIIDNFELNFQLFVNFQLKYYKIWKDTVKDFNLVLIFLLCGLNNFYLIRKNYPEKSKIDPRKTFTTQHKLHYQRGLNATSISELSSIPRATVIRKMKWFFDRKLITKDKNNLYSIKLNNDYSNNYLLGKLPSVIEEISNYLSNSYKNY